MKRVLPKQQGDIAARGPIRAWRWLANQTAWLGILLGKALKCGQDAYSDQLRAAWRQIRGGAQHWEYIHKEAAEVRAELLRLYGPASLHQVQQVYLCMEGLQQRLDLWKGEKGLHRQAGRQVSWLCWALAQGLRMACCLGAGQGIHIQIAPQHGSAAGS